MKPVEWPLTHSLRSASLQCVPPDEACTSLDASMIWAMMQNKKTFTKPLAVIHHEVESKGVFWEAQRMGPQGCSLGGFNTVSPVLFKRYINGQLVILEKDSLPEEFFYLVHCPADMWFSGRDTFADDFLFIIRSESRLSRSQCHSLSHSNMLPQLWKKGLEFLLAWKGGLSMIS